MIGFMLFPTLPVSLTPALALILTPILPLTLILTGRGPQHASWRAHGPEQLGGTELAEGMDDFPTS